MLEYFFLKKQAVSSKQRGNACSMSPSIKSSFFSENAGEQCFIILRRKKGKNPKYNTLQRKTCSLMKVCPFYCEKRLFLSVHSCKERKWSMFFFSNDTGELRVSCMSFIKEEIYTKEKQGCQLLAQRRGMSQLPSPDNHSTKTPSHIKTPPLPSVTFRS